MADYGHGITASGLKPVKILWISTIAVDPNVIPLVIPFVMAFTTADTGYQDIIDVFLILMINVCHGENTLYRLYP